METYQNQENNNSMFIQSNTLQAIGNLPKWKGQLKRIRSQIHAEVKNVANNTF